MTYLKESFKSINTPKNNFVAVTIKYILNLVIVLQLVCAQVRVVLMKTEKMCSVAFKDRHTQEVALPPGSSVVVPYTIVPLAVGKLPLEVMVVSRGMMEGDRIQKFLRVVVSQP